MATLIGGRCLVAPQTDDGHNETKKPSLDETTSGGDPLGPEPQGPSATASSSPGTPYMPRPNTNRAVRTAPSAKKSPSSTAGALRPGGTSSGAATSGTTSNPGGSSSGSSSQPHEPSCETFDGENAPIGGDGGEAYVLVTIKVCDGVIVEVGSGTMMSNYEPTNTDALAALNVLAVEHYKTAISKIMYSGATATASAFRTSLQSAMTLAGI